MPRMPPAQAAQPRRHRLEAAVFWLFTLGVVLLLALWTRSYWRTDALDLRVTYHPIEPGGFYWRHVKLWSSRGGYILRWERHTFTAARPADHPPLDWITAPSGEYYDYGADEFWLPLHHFSADYAARGGMSVRRDGRDPDSPQTGSVAYVGDWFHFPQWTVVVLVAIPPSIILLRRLRRRKRRRLGLCPECGYDLRASNGRCPECGDVAVTTMSATTAVE
jgi:hypothetical protein